MSKPESFRLTIPAEEVEGRIYLIRNQRVMLDVDVAVLYQVQTPAVDEAVLKNPARFPKDFYFEVNEEELKALKDQVGFVPVDDGTPTLAFTEAGVAMLSVVLDNPQAARMSTTIMRNFTQLRQVCVPPNMVVTREEFAVMMQNLTAALENMDEKNDERVKALLGTMQKMAHGEDPPEERQIGFDTGLEKK